MSLGSKIESFTKKATSHLIKNTRGLPFRAATTTIGMMVAGGIGVVAFQDPSFVATVQETLGGNSLKVGTTLSQAMFDAGSIGGAGSLAMMGVSKLLKNPINAIERWSNNSPAEIIHKASRKADRNPEDGQKYIAKRLEAMTPQERQTFSEYVDSSIEYAKSQGTRQIYGMEGRPVTSGIVAYDKAVDAMKDSAKQDREAKKDFSASSPGSLSM